MSECMESSPLNKQIRESNVKRMLKLEFLLSLHLHQNKHKKNTIIRKLRVLSYFLGKAGISHHKIQEALSNIF